jgi:enoyl-CoA hydratase/carnithine racemase
MMYKPFLSVLDIEVPVIGALNGHAIGGGLGLTLVCDIRVANKDAKYGANFTKLGLHPGMATTYLLPRFIGVPRAAELLLTGRIITGAQAEDYGLMNYTDWNPIPAARHEAELQSRTIITDDFKEGSSAMMEKRTPEFHGK